MRISDWSSDVCSSDLAIDAWMTRSVTAATSGWISGTGLSFVRAEPAAARKIENALRQAQGERSCDHAGLQWMSTGSSTSASTRPIGKGDDGPCSIACSRSEEHTSELQSLMRHSYTVFC